MSTLLQIIGAKPNPRGRDNVNSESLMGETTDIKNIGKVDALVGQMTTLHTAFDSSGKPHAKPVVYWKGKAEVILPPGKILRIHGGHEANSSSMRNEDRNGADIHVFREVDTFVLNNKEGDHIYLTYEGQNVDEAKYKPNPPEGQRLVRKGEWLVPLEAEEAVAAGCTINTSNKPIIGKPDRFA